MIQIKIAYDPRHETGLITLEDMQRPSCDAITTSIDTPDLLVYAPSFGGADMLEAHQARMYQAICHQLANLLYTYQQAAQPGQKELA
jgi:hypothetical protein